MQWTKLIALSFSLLLATPALAQMPPPMQDTRPEHGKMMMPHGGKMLDGMSTEGRKLVAVAMIDRREKMKSHADARKAARDKVRAAMMADSFSAASLRAAFEDERKVAAEQQKDNHEHMIGLMGKLSNADRKIFAASTGELERRLMSRHDMKGDRRGREGKRGDAEKPTL
jgi:uncharacterized membrane protein